MLSVSNTLLFVFFILTDCAQFIHSGRTLHAMKKVAQVSLLAWVLSPPRSRSPPPPFLCSADAGDTQQQQSAAATVAAAAAMAIPVVFVVAVGQRTLQPFLLDPKSLVRPLYLSLYLYIYI